MCTSLDLRKSLIAQIALVDILTFEGEKLSFTKSTWISTCESDLVELEGAGMDEDQGICDFSSLLSIESLVPTSYNGG
eukprot:CAMPEP_0113614694 /NCGR_PEP_ID=MMETSP0017_2-20120614/7307_1 /TAXON_ID=2856 /ORGANISM="Cylindrotheca closterium" /LENGTH=77 /DNA_ID=CAMNT_0000523887 /DNA_START=262 /DNA_END=498 /DNA_ORIENTATION=+ /assembly_acc=CAM_ASM_000147